MKKCYLIICYLLIWFSGTVEAQKSGPNLPQRTVQLAVVQHLDYGQILLPSGSSGGTVVIDYAGARQLNNGLVAYPGDTYSQAILSFNLCPGRTINIQYAPSIQLTDNASHSMAMTIDKIRVGNTLLTASGQSFSSNKGCNDLHYMELGTTLTVKGTSFNPPGTYNGSFNITVAYQ